MKFSIVFVAGAFALIIAGIVGQEKEDHKVEGSDNATGILDSLGLMESGSIADFILESTKHHVELEYFGPDEFQGWYDKMSPELLLKLDEFRRQWGYPVHVSPHPDAVGREYYAGHDRFDSQHNYIKWGEVRAIDVFPKNSAGEYITSVGDRKRAYEIAVQVGFTGVGIYTDTVPGNMMHLDVRQAALAKWSRVSGEFLSVFEVLV